MKVEVWTRAANATKLWEGDLESIPRERDWFSVDEDHASLMVHAVAWVMKPTPYVIITVKGGV